MDVDVESVPSPTVESRRSALMNRVSEDMLQRLPPPPTNAGEEPPAITLGSEEWHSEVPQV